MAGGSGVKGRPGRFTIVSGSAAGAREGGGGEGRRRPAHHSLHLISGRCALRKARASRSPEQEGGTRLLSHRHHHHHVLPRQEEHPADHGESGSRRLPPTLAGSPCAAGGAAWIPGPSWSPGRHRDPSLGVGERRSV